MKKTLPLSILVFFAILNTQTTHAQSTSYLSISVGYYDVFDEYEAADIRLEYRPDKNIGIENLKPWIGTEITSDASMWTGGGLLYDWNVTDNIYITPSIGAGFYVQGSSDKDLGHAIEFRSQLEASYQFEDTSRAGIAFSHTSNASLDNNNPGTEVISLYYHVPFGELF